MKFTVSGNRLYSNNVIFSHIQIKPELTKSSYKANPQYSHNRERDLVFVDGLGWMGGDDECDIVVGRVVNSEGKVIPCRLTENRMMIIANLAEDSGANLMIEVEHG